MTSALTCQHRLPVKSRLDFKILLLNYAVLRGQAPDRPSGPAVLVPQPGTGADIGGAEHLALRPPAVEAAPHRLSCAAIDRGCRGTQTRLVSLTLLARGCCTLL